MSTAVKPEPITTTKLIKTSVPNPKNFKTGSGSPDPYPDFTDPDPDPTRLPDI
jgi:hypothetical protein